MSVFSCRFVSFSSATTVSNSALVGAAPAETVASAAATSATAVPFFTPPKAVNGVPSGFHRRAGTSMAPVLCFFLPAGWMMKSWVNALIRHLLPWRS